MAGCDAHRIVRFRMNTSGEGQSHNAIWMCPAGKNLIEQGGHLFPYQRIVDVKGARGKWFCSRGKEKSAEVVIIRLTHIRQNAKGVGQAVGGRLRLARVKEIHHDVMHVHHKGLRQTQPAPTLDHGQAFRKLGRRRVLRSRRRS